MLSCFHNGTKRPHVFFKAYTSTMIGKGKKTDILIVVYVCLFDGV